MFVLIYFFLSFRCYLKFIYFDIYCFLQIRVAGLVATIVNVTGGPRGISGGVEPMDQQRIATTPKVIITNKKIYCKINAIYQLLFFNVTSPLKRQIIVIKLGRELFPPFIQCYNHHHHYPLEPFDQSC